ncbi:MAG: stage 0 sporulation family protein [Agathobacter sp.]|nr:stage 0 sporulation family protein [Agathobacter sp.]
MTKVVGIRFQKAGKIYYFDPCDFDLETGMHAIVETARGVEMGTVLLPPREVEDEKVIQPLKPVLRIATDEDERIVEINKEKEKEAFAICKEKILKHGLEMKLVNAEYTFDNNKLLFYFTADGRIDFRELVKDLAAVFRTRIELRQIGVRDETKILGGIGICGRPLCCKTYLSDFVPVSIKMAKEQNLSLNPTKISGVCGRLMCCLKNEQDTYEYLNSRLPSVGDVVYTKDGVKGEVQTVNVLRQQVKLVVDNGEEKELREYKIEELNFRPKKRKDVKITEEELKELEGLEDETPVEEVTERQEKPRKFNKERKFDKEHKFDKERSYNKNETETENESTDKVDEENVSANENGENRPYKKRYDGKGKRYFGKNKKRHNNSSENE